MKLAQSLFSCCMSRKATNPGDSCESAPKTDAIDGPASSAGDGLLDRQNADDRADTDEERLERLNAHEPGALHEAAAKGNVDDVRFLIQHGRSVHETDDESGDTVLHRAVQRGHLDVIAELLRNGVEVDARNKEGRLLCFLRPGSAASTLSMSSSNTAQQ
ncbi:hypothetical protein Gpo141_00013233 [Globisporangium polare]